MNPGELIKPSPGIEAAIEARLPPLQEPAPAGWSFWEKKSFTLHRVVARWVPERKFSGIEEFRDSVRGEIEDRFPSSWWRGMAFGVIVVLPELPFSPMAAAPLIDTRNRLRGVWQWVVFQCVNQNAVLGIHTWIEAFLSPVYRGILHDLATSGYELASIKRGKSGLMSALVSAAQAARLVNTLGLGKIPFAEFENRPGTDADAPVPRFRS